MMLDARVVVDRGGFVLDAELSADPGEVVAVLGPNGAGKTTLLRALAGLEPFTDGYFRLGGSLVEEPATGVRRRTQQRDVGVVFDQTLLFPHLSVRDNVAFGPRSHGAGRSAAQQTAERWLRDLELAELGRRRPRQLSGGQAQRVAIARALATEPTLLLLDEPLSAVDAGGRQELRSFLRHQLGRFGGVSLLITHDTLDALMLADRLVVLEAGRVVQSGPPDRVAAAPRSEHVATMVGLNLFQGVSAAGVVRLDGEAEIVTAQHTDGEVFACFKPSAVALHRERPAGSPRNVWPATVVSLATHGDAVRVHLSGPLDLDADVTPQALQALRLTAGADVWVSVKATEVAVYAA